jgi:hypothetical protein
MGMPLCYRLPADILTMLPHHRTTAAQRRLRRPHVTKSSTKPGPARMVVVRPEQPLPQFPEWKERPCRTRWRSVPDGGFVVLSMLFAAKRCVRRHGPPADHG